MRIVGTSLLLALTMFPSMALRGDDFPEKSLVGAVFGLKTLQLHELSILAYWGFQGIRYGLPALLANPDSIIEPETPLAEIEDLLMDDESQENHDISQEDISVIEDMLVINQLESATDFNKTQSSSMPREDEAIARRAALEERKRMVNERRRTNQSIKKTKLIAKFQQDKTKQTKVAPPARTVILSQDAVNARDQLKNDQSKKGRLAAVIKALEYLRTNVWHRSLKIHPLKGVTALNGEQIYEAYAENDTPGAYRIFWHNGPGHSIIVVAIGCHLKLKKNN